MFAFLIRTTPRQAAGLIPQAKCWSPCLQTTGFAYNVELNILSGGHKGSGQRPRKIDFYYVTIAYHVELNAIPGGRKHPANVQE